MRCGLGCLWALVALTVTATIPALLDAQEDKEQTSALGAISGRVLGVLGQDTLVLAHALVEMRQPRYISTSANQGGHYLLSRVPAGHVSLRVVHAGYGSMELDVVLAPGDTLQLDMILQGAPVDLGRISVEGSGEDGSRNALGELSADEEVDIGLEAMGTTNGMSASGLIQAARRQSGSDPLDPTALLFMRGSAADLKLVLLDGAQIYAPFHMGGILDPIEPNVVGKTKLILGGASARYNGGLSHIFEIETRRPGNAGNRAEATLDLMGAGATIERAIGAGGVMISGRTLHNLGNTLFSDSPAPYGYWDLIGRGELPLSENHRLSLTTFLNRETVNVDPLFGLRALPLSDEANYAAPGLGRDASWQNAALSLRYSGQFGDTRLNVSASQTAYDAELPVGDATLIILSGSANRSHLGADVTHALSTTTEVAFGASLDRLTVEDDVEIILGSATRVPGPAQDAGTMAGAYVEVQRTFPQGFTLRGGLRGDAFPTDARGVDLSPRASLIWAISERAVFRLAAGRFTKLARRSDPAVESVIGARNPTFLRQDLLSVASATHLVASLDQSLTDHVSAGFEGFVKSYQGLAELDGKRLNSSGVDLRLRGQSATGLKGWVGYTLTWFWSEANVTTPNSFSGHHLLNAGLGGRFLGPLAGQLRVSYGAGLPFTAIPFANAESDAAVDGPEPNLDAPVQRLSEIVLPLPDKSFLRVDLTVSGTWDMVSLGRSLSITPYLKVINALDRRDSQFFYLDRWRDTTARPLASLPVLPILGLRITF